MNGPRYTAQAFSAGQGDPVPRHRRNPRRVYDRDGREIRPMDLANAIKNGVRAIRATCLLSCGYEGEVPINRFTVTTLVPDVGLRLRCTAFGRKGQETEPVWPRRDGL